LRVNKGEEENRDVESLFCLFWVMCLVCYQNSVCVCGYIQLIWTLSVQEYVLSVLGDLLMCFEIAFR
jgi:hypothetical protein